MISKKFLPVWYGGGIGNNRNALCGVGHLSCTGFFPNTQIMSTKTLSKEAEIRLTNFFNQTVTPEQMAKALRQVNFVVSLSLIRENETLQQEILKLENSFYWLNELAEILNPYLDVE
ncbi:hypothetical protein L1276_004797 [Flavobacterium sp. HSC-32F16]|uniref:hypothetical protein n=1 Tax=Flavobacterium sp. HSC-32F16 TaxID=2910964 RepID=UPI00353200D1|nr:hypothetical protein [Flavobacterium sp. HSC-32F16]